MGVLATTWRLVNKRVSAHRDPARDQALIQRLGHAINVILRKDSQRWIEDVGEEVKRLVGMYPFLHREDWHRMKGWYLAAVDNTLPPAWFNLEWITAERVDLY